MRQAFTPGDFGHALYPDLNVLPGSRRPMRPRPDPRRRLVFAHLEHAAGRLDL